MVLHLCPSWWGVAFSSYTETWGHCSRVAFFLLCVLPHPFYLVTAIFNFSCLGKCRSLSLYWEKQGLLTGLKLKSLFQQRMCVQQGRTAIFVPGSCTCCCSFIDCKEKKWAALQFFFPFSLECICCYFLSHPIVSSHCCSANFFGWNSYTKNRIYRCLTPRVLNRKQSFKSFSFRKDWKWKLIETQLHWASETWKQTLIPSHLLDTVACIALPGWGWENVTLPYAIPRTFSQLCILTNLLNHEHFDPLFDCIIKKKSTQTHTYKIPTTFHLQ